jgi:hypothetical protein
VYTEGDDVDPEEFGVACGGDAGIGGDEDSRCNHSEAASIFVSMSLTVRDTDGGGDHEEVPDAA